ncbi:MAG: GNAT family N-acetyltransferase [Thermoleophilia bacterium]|nr:GNAT family N-acetyltransferase [Thermoleophilia bacterium]
MPLPYAEVLTITPDVLLRAIGHDDIAEFRQALVTSEDSLRPWLPYILDLKTDDDVAAYIDMRIAGRIEDATAEWIIWAEGQFAGVVNLNGIQAPNLATDIGYWLVPDAQGQGLATAAALRLLQHLFDDLQFNRVSAWCMTENAASRAVPVRLGMVEEAYRPQLWRVHDEFVDAVGYRMLAAEWRALA